MDDFRQFIGKAYFVDHGNKLRPILILDISLNGDAFTTFVHMTYLDYKGRVGVSTDFADKFPTRHEFF